MAYPATQTYWLDETDIVAVGLRRYHSSPDPRGFECFDGYHSALIYTDREPARFSSRNDGWRYLASRETPPHDCPQWPTTCEHCDYAFDEDDHWQAWQELIYRRPDTGEEFVLHQHAPSPTAPSAPPGASWDAWWMSDFWKGPDGIHLMVRLPNGHDWCVDSEASNCTRRGEPHQCWVRHGDPHECHLTVDKNGDTCAAGAGSVQGGDYHGFLIAGELTPG